MTMKALNHAVDDDEIELIFIQTLDLMGRHAGEADIVKAPALRLLPVPVDDCLRQVNARV